MNDLIDRQAAIRTLVFAEETGDMKCGKLREVLEVLNRVPPAQCWTPVRNGRWMTKEYEYGTNGEHDRWVERIAVENDYAYCSQCGGGILLDGGEDYVYSAYCPHCGAKMEEVKNE